ncbi:hypothetical protein [Kineococcus glutinatus]|uniref:von Willebrand factor type A domain-containing protein n=1 Tax=Kineococcus glutinatus TaxID=1070872 RepID=A0ABP9HEB0_9ACTN
MRGPAGLGGLGDVGRLGDVGALPRARRWPWLLLLAALLPLVWLLAQRGSGPDTAPTTLSAAQLEGERGPGCVRLAVMSDDSSSMLRFSAARTAAVQEVLRWAPGNLRGDDQLTVVDFAGSAATTLPTVAIADSAGAQPVPPPALLDGTSLTSALEELAARGASPCRTLAVVVSDGFVDETDRGEVAASVDRAGIESVVLLLPSRQLDVPSTWRAVLPDAAVVGADAADPRATALALGRVLADFLGVRLGA